MKQILNFILSIIIVCLHSCDYNTNEEIPFNATVTKEYHPNRKLKKEYYTLPNDAKLYNYREYFKNGTLSLEYKTDENRIYYYNEKGVIEQVAVSSNGIETDTLYSYYNYPKKIKSKVVFHEDDKVESYWYYPNGKPEEQRAILYHTGMIHAHIKFDKNGKVLSQESRYLNANYIDKKHTILAVELKGQVPCDSLTVFFLNSFDEEHSDTIEVLGFKSNKVKLKLRDEYWQDRLHISFETIHFVDKYNSEIEDFYLQLDKDEIPKKYNIDAIKK